MFCLPLVLTSRLGVSSVPYLDEIQLFDFSSLPKVTDCSAEIINILSKRNPNTSGQNSAFSAVDAKTNLRGKCQHGKKVENEVGLFCGMLLLALCVRYMSEGLQGRGGLNPEASSGPGVCLFRPD